MKDIKLNIIGNPFTEDGFGNHTRNFAKALSKQVDTTLETQVAPGWETNCEQEIYDMITNFQKQEKQKERVNIMIAHPHHWPIFWNKPCKGFIGYVVFEGSKIPKGWVEYLEDDHVDCILVPSTHVKDAILAQGVKKNIHIIPEGVDIDIFKKSDKIKELTLGNAKFRFLFNKGWNRGERDRSGLDIALVAFIEQFHDNPEIGLILKTNAVYGNSEADISKILQVYPDKKCEVILVTSNIPHTKLPELYSSAECLIAPAKAEGFGLNIAEAMACEVPVIATNYGGHLDFLTTEEGFLINGTMIPATENNKMYEDAEWAVPDIVDLKRIMSYVYREQDKLKELGIKSRNKIKEFTWEKAASKLVSELKEMY